MNTTGLVQHLSPHPVDLRYRLRATDERNRTGGGRDKWSAALLVEYWVKMMWKEVTSPSNRIGFTGCLTLAFEIKK